MKTSLSIKDSSLIAISLALNINRSRLSNLAYFKYAKITKLLYLLFINIILISIT